MAAPAPTRPEPPAAAAILDATERLLADRRFPDLAVGDIIAAAGVSRTSFYAHFSSRAGVLAACLRRVVGAIGVAVDPFVLAVDGGGDPREAIRTSLGRWVELAGAHGPLLRTASEEWPHDPELEELWFAMLGAFADGVAGVIERARASGRAPGGADPLALASVLMWGCERVLHVALAGGTEGLEDPAAIVEPLAQVVAGGAFGETGPGVRGRTRRPDTRVDHPS